jgi:hypothetical protein
MSTNTHLKQKLSAEQMLNVVVFSKMRPEFPKGWACIQPLDCLVETVEECWDQDAETRLTAQCVVERTNMCIKVCTELASQIGVSPGKTFKADDESSKPHFSLSNGQQKAGEWNGSVQLQQTPAASRQLRLLDLNKAKPVKTPLYLQNGSSSPPPYSAVPPPCLIPEKTVLRLA